MKKFNRCELIKAAGSAVALLTLFGVGSAVAQQAQSNRMEETTVSTSINPVVAHAPRVQPTGIQVRTRAVSYADLNLDREPGIHTLYGRLETAAQEVCSPRQSFRNRALRDDWRSCYSDAMDNAVHEIGNLGLERYHMAQTGAGAPPVERIADR